MQCSKINLKKWLPGKLTGLGLILFILVTQSLNAQIRNVWIEGDSDQVAVIQALENMGEAGSSGIEFIRGNELSLTDWRILNDNGVFRIQSETNNFLTNGINRFSISEDGFLGVGCTNPQAKLTICNGEIAFSNGLNVDEDDKISLNGFNFDMPNMVGLGFETTTIFDGMNLVDYHDLYYKAHGSHRWYSNTNADNGTSAFMVLDRDGKLGIGTPTPAEELEVVGRARINDLFPMVELYQSGTEQVEGFFASTGGYSILGSLHTDLHLAASNVGSSDIRMTIKGSSGFVGINNLSPVVDLDVGGVVRSSALDIPRFELLNAGSGQYHGYYGNSGNQTKIYSPFDDIALCVGGDASDDARLLVDRSSGFVSIGYQIPSVNLHVFNGTDVDLTGGGYLQLGSSGSTNLVLDDNEIMAKDDGSSSELHIQRDVGDLLLCGNDMGQVGIGIFDVSDLPDEAYILAVDGKILAEEVRVELSQAWPDYVFETDYKLISLPELEKVINENGHLPGIPSAREIESEGFELADMQRMQMEKIEELTLYIIQLEKRIQELEENK